MLVLVVLLLRIANALVYNVKSDDNKSINGNDTDSAENLSYYLQNTSKYFSSHSYLHFEMGHHYLSTDLVIQNVTNVTMTGEAFCIIRCTANVGIIIHNVTNFTLDKITVENCSANYKIIHPHRNLKYSGDASLLLYYCVSVEIDNVAIFTKGSTGILIVNVRNYSKITNVSIIIHINDCSLVNKKLLVIKHGILLYHDNRKNPYNKSSEIQIEIFKFNTNGSCAHPYTMQSNCYYYRITQMFLLLYKTQYLKI